MTSNPKANGHNTSESPMKDQENSRDPLTS